MTYKVASYNKPALRTWVHGNTSAPDCVVSRMCFDLRNRFCTIYTVLTLSKVGNQPLFFQ